MLALILLLAVNVPALLRDTAPVRAMDEAALRRMVPGQSGLFYVGCPNCNNGHQERQLDWDPARPEEVFCRYCKHRYPSAKYPMDKSVRVRNPRGEEQSYPYWEDAKGYRFFFAARRDDLAREYLAGQAAKLAQLYTATKKPEHAQRAALLLQQFAAVFPGWCYHYDYPFRQKEIFSGVVPASKFLPGYRTARWTWWAYNDMPVGLLQAYESIRETMSATDRKQVERDLFRNIAEQQLGNPEPYTNMSPRLWAGLVRLGRVIGEPRYVRETEARLQTIMRDRFFYDGSWCEGSPSYARQTVGSVRQVAELRGDAVAVPGLAAAEQALDKMRLPDGRFVPVHDTWSYDHGAALKESLPYLLPAVGHGELGGGKGDAQWQVHLTWAGGYGHEHADGLSTIVFARGRELLSDLGYTHTKYRAWTLTTASHNTVVIDGQNQTTSATDGSLRWFDTSHPRVQVVSAERPRAYPGLAKTYRRTLVVVDGKFVIDWFEVEGGKVHDYFLHGDADRAGTVKLPGAATEVAPPAGWQATRNEGDTAPIKQPYYSFGFLRNQREMRAAGVQSIEMPEGLRVHFVAEAGDRLYAGTNPAIRGAGEDDAKLEQFQRGFFRVRREGGKSVFVSVIELQPGVGKVERTARGVKVGDVEIEISAAGVRVPALGYAMAAAKSVPFEGFDKLPAGLVKLVTIDGWVYPVTRADAGAFAWDGKTLRLLRFPQRTHPGPVRVER